MLVEYLTNLLQSIRPASMDIQIVSAVQEAISWLQKQEVREVKIMLPDPGMLY